MSAADDQRVDSPPPAAATARRVSVDQFDVAAAGTAETDHSNHPAATSESQQIDAAWRIRFRIGISRRYNIRLARHYGGLQNTATVISLVSGSAAFADILRKPSEIALYASLAVVVLSALKLAFRWSDKARLHEDLYRQYTRLQERLVRSGAVPNEETLREIEADFVMVEAGEPAVLNALMVDCHNQEVVAQGADPSYQRSLRFWQHLAAPFVSLPPFTWKK